MDLRFVAFVGAVAGACAALWLLYLRWKDHRHPEPAWVFVVSALLGALAILPALFGYAALARAGATASWTMMSSGPLRDALLSSLTIGAAEESAKLLPAFVLALRTRSFDEMLDGPIYAAAAGVGFAFAETVVLATTGELALLDVVARAATSPATHALFAVVWGVGLSHAVHHRRWWALVVGLVASILLHAGYDLVLARLDAPPLSALIVLVIWAWALRFAARWSKLAPVKSPARGAR